MLSLENDNFWLNLQFADYLAYFAFTGKILFHLVKNLYWNLLNILFSHLKILFMNSFSIISKYFFSFYIFYFVWKESMLLVLKSGS